LLVIGLALLTAAAAEGSTARAPLPGLITSKLPWSANDGSSLRARLKAIGLHALSREGVTVHIHQHLDIVINGRVLRGLPPYIGIHIDEQHPSRSFITEIHTHDQSGIIHVESPTVRTFTLGDFFDVWGVRFSSRCLGGYCANGSQKIYVWVNAKRVRTDPREIVLKSHQEIVVAYGTLASVPKPLPPSYPFPQGY
jgi:hypothetical protein